MDPSKNKLFSLSDYAIAAAAGVFGLCLYVITLAPGLLPGDSGEFQTLAYLLGNTHPTGYSFYLLLARLFILMPTGDIAYRVNLFSAFLGALVIAGVYLIGRVITNQRIPPLLGSLALAVSTTFWSQAIIAEVYTAGALWLVIILLGILVWDVTGNPRALFIATMAGGMSLGIHLSAALAGLPVAVFLILNWKSWKDFWKPALSGLLAGLAIFLAGFFVVNSFNSPLDYFNTIIRPSVSAWGLTPAEIASPLGRLWFSLSGIQFNAFMFADPARIMPLNMGAFGANLSHELALLTLILSVVGIVFLFAQQYKTAILLAGGLLYYAIILFNYTVLDLYVFYIPLYLLLAILASAGLAGLVALVNKLVKIRRASWIEMASVLAIALAIWPVFGPALSEMRAGRPPITIRDDPGSRGFERMHPALTSIVQNIDPGAIVFTDWDSVYPLYYVAFIEEGRSDLTFIETFPGDDVKHYDMAQSAIAYIEEQLPTHPVFFADLDPKLWNAGFTFTPANVGGARYYRLGLKAAVK
jgi:asparagine N-glycosylation enzyme membrane subunit Stt3